MGGWGKRFKPQAIIYSTKPIEAKESFWMTAPREGFGSICQSEWERRMKGTRFDREIPPMWNTDARRETPRRAVNMNYNPATNHFEREKLRYGFSLME